LELESAKLVVSANGDNCAALLQPSLYPGQEELHNSARIVLTLPTLNLFPAEVLGHGIVKTIAYSSLAAVF
jgi:hypothetical protein